MATGTKTLSDLFLSTLRDIYDAEHQILKALPKMADAAVADELREAFEQHAEETEGQVARIEQVFAAIGQKPRAKRCAAIRAILAEGEEAIAEYGGTEDGDVALAASAQAVEHYEIARYGTLKAWAGELGHDNVVQLLDATLQEETSTDRTLDALRQRLVGEMTGFGPEAETSQNRETPRSLRAAGGSSEERNMARDSNDRERDENGRFMSDDDNRGGSRSGSRSSGNRDRDENGRFASDDDDNRGSSRGRSSSNRDRDENGRFASDDDNRGSSRGRSNNGSNDRDRDENGRFVSDDDNRGRSRDDDDRGSSRSRSRDDDDSRSSSRSGGGRGQGGWFGDSEGHSEASRRGWETRDDDNRSSSRGRSRDDDDRGSSRSRSDDDDRSSSRSNRGNSQGGWFGDSEGHSEASRRGWENRDDNRSFSRSRSNDDDYRSSSRGRDDDNRGSSRSGGNDQRGWFGDSEGHAEAARRGWEHRDDDNRSSSRGRSNDDDNRSSSRSRSQNDDSRSSRSGNQGGNNQGGWFGDSEGHAEAARRGWEHRDDDNRSSWRGRSNDDDNRSSSGRSSSSRGDDNRSSRSSR